MQVTHYMWYEFVPVMAWWLVPIGQQAFNRTHGDKDKASHLVSSGHNKNNRKPDEKCIRQKVVACV